MFRLLLVLVYVACAFAADTPSPATTPGAPPSAPPPAPSPARAKLSSTAARNENVAIWQIDNNSIKEVNIRVGTRATVQEFGLIDSNYYATEHGQPPSESLALPAIPARLSGLHMELFEVLQNSVFNARTFFQVGPVMPSRRNNYGFRGTAEIKHLGFLTISGFQRKIRGMVNGNVLVPLASERIPLTTDLATRAMVQRFIDAYPNQLPNRPDFDPRALNTNAPQRIDETGGMVRLDRTTSSTSAVNLSYTLNRAATDAFQLVAGQNPDTDIHSHRAKIAWRKAFGAFTDLVLAGGFQRTRSALVSEPNAVGPRVRFGYQIEELGPDSQFPIDRAVNSFRYGAQVGHRQGKHTWTAGADISRNQLNGIETNNQRGVFQFSNNFGRTALENMQYGTPTQYEVTIGDLSRGYRNWSGAVYAQDQWKVSKAVQLTLGLRWSAETAPTEIRNRDRILYACDCNNFSPRIAVAWTMPDKWVLRAAGTISYGTIQPVTYQQIRNNLPLVHYVQRQNPSLVDPLAGVDLNDPATRVSPTDLSPDLTSAYSTQYNLTFERRFAPYTIRFGYLGSRSYKLINSFVTNRAQPVPGVPLTTATVDQRRADPRYSEIKTIANGGNAYFDAALVTFDLPVRRGLQASATYVFSKALDQGADFTTIAANRDLSTRRAQSEFDSYPDRKSLSDFDSTHSLSLDWSWQVPSFGRMQLFRGWQISGATLLKVGTPLTLFVGSDSPGFGNVDGSASDRPSILDPAILGRTVGDPNTAPLLISRERFDYIHPGELRGSLGRNTFRKAPIHNLNAAVSKQWTFRGRREWSALFRAEAWNVTNTPQFDEPQRNLSSPSFGRITNTLNDGRVFQLSVRLML